MVCHHPATLADGGGVGGGVSVGKLDLSDLDASYGNLINVPPQGTGSPGAPDAAICDTLSPEAGSDSGIFRVVPGDPTHSLLCLKVKGYFTPPPCGGPMPLGAEIPDGGQDAAFQEIKEWITQGANP